MSTVTVIEPTSRLNLSNLAEVWRSHELLRMLTVRDLKIRYKQTVFGVGWAVLQPFAMMVVFTIVLNGAAGVQSEPGVPYPIYVYAGLIIWLYFADAITRASRSLVTNSMLVSKVYFPRLIAPLSGVAAPLVDFGLAMAILVVLMLWYRIDVSWTILFVLPLLLATLLSAAAFGIWLAALNVEYRDIGYAVPLVVQLGMFLTPVVYSPEGLHGTLRIIYSVNPMAGIVMAFRWAVLHRGPVDWGILASSLTVMVIVLISGLIFFRHVERSFADTI